MHAVKNANSILVGAVLTLVSLPLRVTFPLGSLVALSLPNPWAAALLFYSFSLLGNYALARYLFRYKGGWWLILGSSFVHACLAALNWDANFTYASGGCWNCNSGWIVAATYLPVTIGQAMALLSGRRHSGLKVRAKCVGKLFLSRLQGARCYEPGLDR